MTDKEILMRAINRAKENGYLGRPHNDEELDDLLYDCSMYDIIFSHDFCKAFWGNHEKYITGYQYGFLPIVCQDWQHHLQQMVVLPDKQKLRYLEKFL